MVPNGLLSVSEVWNDTQGLDLLINGLQLVKFLVTKGLDFAHCVSKAIGGLVLMGGQEHNIDRLAEIYEALVTFGGLFRGGTEFGWLIRLLHFGTNKI